MSQAVITRSVQARSGAGRAVNTSAMTCDIPVIRPQGSVPTSRRNDGALCRPTGRDQRRSQRVYATVSGRKHTVRTERMGLFEAADQAARRPEAAAANHSNTAAVIRRRRVVGALVLGAIMAAVVWTLALAGGAYEEAATSATPAATQVVHVRTGESLTDVARRIAPNLPTEGVIAELRALNGLDSSGLRVSQPLVAPAY